MFTKEEIEKRFAYHKPANQDVCNLHEIVRGQCKRLALMISEAVPSCREQSLAMTHLEEVMYWANAAVARTYAQKTEVPDFLPNPEWKSTPEPNVLPTYRAEITMGMKEGYDGETHKESEVLERIGDYCDVVGLGVEVHFGWCVYTKGMEPCARISLINYPRFPSEPSKIWSHAITLGMKLAVAFKQQRFTIIATDKTRMFEL